MTANITVSGALRMAEEILEEVTGLVRLVTQEAQQLWAHPVTTSGTPEKTLTERGRSLGIISRAGAQVVGMWLSIANMEQKQADNPGGCCEHCMKDNEQVMAFARALGQCDEQLDLHGFKGDLPIQAETAHDEAILALNREHHQEHQATRNE